MGLPVTTIPVVCGVCHPHVGPARLPAEEIDVLSLADPVEEEDEDARHARAEEAHRPENGHVEAARQGLAAPLLGGDLAPPVGAERALRVVLGYGHRARDAVDPRARYVD